jgi:hypothetical protein
MEFSKSYSPAGLKIPKSTPLKSFRNPDYGREKTQTRHKDSALEKYGGVGDCPRQGSAGANDA